MPSFDSLLQEPSFCMDVMDPGEVSKVGQAAGCSLTSLMLSRCTIRDVSTALCPLEPGQDSWDMSMMSESVMDDSMTRDSWTEDSGATSESIGGTPVRLRYPGPSVPWFRSSC